MMKTIEVNIEGIPGITYKFKVSKVFNGYIADCKSLNGWYAIGKNEKDLLKNLRHDLTAFIGSAIKEGLKAYKKGKKI